MYKVLDLTPSISFPFTVLYSPTLLMLITVHSRDVWFRHAVTGDVITTRSNIAGNAELTCAVLDSRAKKLVLGDSRGVLTIFNCISGALLKTIEASTSSLLHVIYSPDKTILCFTGQGDIIVVDDSPRDTDSVVVLRTFEKSHDADVMCFAYSHAMGIIATTDCLGTLMVWDYEFFRLLLTVEYYFSQFFFNCSKFIVTN